MLLLKAVLRRRVGLRTAVLAAFGATALLLVAGVGLCGGASAGVGDLRAVGPSATPAPPGPIAGGGAPGTQIWSYQGGGLVAPTDTAFAFAQNAQTFIVTHGWQGLYTGEGALDPSYKAVADGVHANYPTANVLFVDWSHDSTTKLPQTAAANITADASAAYTQLAQQTPLGTNPALWNGVTMVGSSFGTYFNALIGSAVSAAHPGQKVGGWVGLDPANPAGFGSNFSFDPSVITNSFSTSVSCRTSAVADDGKTRLGARNYFLQTPDTLGPVARHAACRTALAKDLGDHDLKLLSNTLPAGAAVLFPPKLVYDGIISQSGAVLTTSAAAAAAAVATCARYNGEDSLARTFVVDRQKCIAAVAAATPHAGAQQPAPAPPPPKGPFTGTWRGTYIGIIIRGAGCPNVPISGQATLVAQQSGPSVSGTLTLYSGFLQGPPNSCQVTGRSSDVIPVNGVTVAGNVAAGGIFRFVLAGNHQAVTGAINGATGNATLALRRSG